MMQKIAGYTFGIFVISMFASVVFFFYLLKVHRQEISELKKYNLKKSRGEKIGYYLYRPNVKIPQIKQKWIFAIILLIWIHGGIAYIVQSKQIGSPFVTSGTETYYIIISSENNQQYKTAADINIEGDYYLVDEIVWFYNKKIYLYDVSEKPLKVGQYVEFEGSDGNNWGIMLTKERVFSGNETKQVLLRIIIVLIAFVPTIIMYYMLHYSKSYDAKYRPPELYRGS